MGPSWEVKRLAKEKLALVTNRQSIGCTSIPSALFQVLHLAMDGILTPPISPWRHDESSTGFESDAEDVSSAVAVVRSHFEFLLDPGLIEDHVPPL